MTWQCEHCQRFLADYEWCKCSSYQSIHQVRGKDGTIYVRRGKGGESAGGLKAGIGLSQYTVAGGSHTERPPDLTPPPYDYGIPGIHVPGDTPRKPTNVGTVPPPPLSTTGNQIPADGYNTWTSINQPSGGNAGSYYPPSTGSYAGGNAGGYDPPAGGNYPVSTTGSYYPASTGNSVGGNTGSYYPPSADDFAGGNTGANAGGRLPQAGDDEFSESGSTSNLSRPSGTNSSSGQSKKSSHRKHKSKK